MTKEANTYSASGEVGSVRQRRTRWERIWLDLKKAPPTAIFGMIVIFGYALVSLFAPILAPFGEADTQFSAYQTFSSKHILGTDQIGRDILSRLIYGARNTIGIALITTIISIDIGMTLG